MPSSGASDADAIVGLTYASVADTGRGIPSADLSRVFERFFRVNEHATAAEGSGIGAEAKFLDRR